jgi:hypothetical protein
MESIIIVQYAMNTVFQNLMIFQEGVCLCLIYVRTPVFLS